MPTSYKIRGIEPPDLKDHPASVRKLYWGWVVEYGIKRKDRELARGLDKDGLPLRPIHPETKRNRRSAMTPGGKGDPEAPPLTPGYHKSRTRSLLAGRALSTHAEFYWRFDAWTGDSWSVVLTYQIAQGRDVFGLSPAGVKWVEAQVLKRWAQWKAGQYQDQGPAPPSARGPVKIPAVGSFDFTHATFGAGLGQGTSTADLTPGSFSGGMTIDQWEKHFRAPARAAVPFRPAPKTPPHRTTGAGNNVLLGHVWAKGTRPGPPAPGSAATPKPKPRPRPKPRPQPVPAQPPAWPVDPDSLKAVKKLGGSTGAELVEDQWGRKFVRKRGGSPDHLRSEDQADRLYRDLGVLVPDSKLYDSGGKPVKLAKFIEGETLGSLRSKDPAAYARAVDDVRRGFAADAVLGNWDVIGVNADNVLVDENGRAYRIDNGGSLGFRAQGAPKTARDWDDHPIEYWHMRDASRNPSAAAVFGGLTIDDLARQTAALPNLPAGSDPTVRARLAQARDVMKVATTLRDDRFKADYTDDFAKYTMGLRKLGITARMAAEMKPKSAGDVVPIDENGTPWDHLRGKGSLVGDLKNFIDANGGKYRLIEQWMYAQAGSSWSGASMAVKAYYASQRDAPPSTYFWGPSGGSHADARRRLADLESRAGGRAAVDASWRMLHAFTREYLARADFPGKTPNGTVRIIRTSSDLETGGRKPGIIKGGLKRGVVESGSIFRSVRVAGSNLTLQDVPLHRVLATYWQERSPGSNSGAFLRDSENEFLTMFEGADVDLRGKTAYQTPH